MTAPSIQGLRWHLAVFRTCLLLLLLLTSPLSHAQSGQTIDYFAPLSDIFITDPPPLLSATATSGWPVSFSSVDTSICDVNAGSLVITAAGTCTITASQLGDGSTYLAAPPVNQSFTISLLPQIISFTFSGDQPFGILINPGATSSAGAGAPVSLIYSSMAVCGGEVNELMLGQVGVCTVTANSGAFGNYAAAAPVTLSFNVIPASQTIEFNNPGPQDFNVPIGPGAVASSGLAVEYVSLTPSVCISSSPGVVSFVGVGQCSINATQPGNSNYEAATPVNQEFTVNPVTQTVFFDPISDQPFNSPPTLAAYTDRSTPVSYSSNTPAVCTVTPSGALTFITIGLCTIQADAFASTGYEAAATPAIQSFQVLPSAPLAPTHIVATANGSTTASISFTPGSTGGSPITTYTVTSDPGGIITTGGSSPITVTGLTAGQAYTFTITATNALETSAASAPSNLTTPGAADPYAAGVVFASHFEGTDGDLPVDEAGGNTLNTGYGSISSNQGHTGSSFQVPATGPGPFFSDGKLNFGSGDFTVEMWVNPSALQNDSRVPYAGENPANGAADNFLWAFELSNGGLGWWRPDGTQQSSGHALQLNTWQHVAAVRSAGTTTLYLNGTAVHSFADSADYTRSNPTLWLSSTAHNGEWNRFAGYLDDLRITRGVPRYTANFTPASAAYAGTASVPHAPLNAVAFLANGQLKISFTAPASTGGLPITSYTVTANPGGATASGSASPIVFTGLDTSTAYTFTVTASNSLGTSSPSSPSNSIIPNAAVATVDNGNGSTGTPITAPPVTTPAGTATPVSNPNTVFDGGSNLGATIDNTGTVVIPPSASGSTLTLSASTPTNVAIKPPANVPVIIANSTGSSLKLTGLGSDTVLLTRKVGNDILIEVAAGTARLEPTGNNVSIPLTTTASQNVATLHPDSSSSAPNSLLIRRDRQSISTFVENGKMIYVIRSSSGGGSNSANKFADETANNGIAIYGGETASFSNQGVLSRLKLGSLDGDRNLPGDPLQAGNDPHSQLPTTAPGVIVPQLNGSVSRLDGEPLTEGIRRQLDQTFGLPGDNSSLTFDTATGVVSYRVGPIDGKFYEARFMPVGELLVALSGFSANGFGATNPAQAVSGAFDLSNRGVQLTLSSALGYFTELKGAVQQADPAGGMTLQANGVLAITLRNELYFTQPGYLVQPSKLTGAPLVELDSSGLLTFRDSKGSVQTLYPVLGDSAALKSILQAIDPDATLESQGNGEATAKVGGQEFRLLPQYKMNPLYLPRLHDSWWLDGGSFHYKLGNGRSQAVTIK